MEERIEILRRIAERGKATFEKSIDMSVNPPQLAMEAIDIFVHLLDEIERLKIEFIESKGE